MITQINDVKIEKASLIIYRLVINIGFPRLMVSL